MEIAKPDSWKRLSLPERKQPLGFTALYTDAEAERMMRGVIPLQMEDKWFIYFDGGWLYFLRSWTGACIFALRLAGSVAGVKVVDSWVNRDPQQYTSDDDGYDRKLVGFLVDALLLDKATHFPRPTEHSESPSGLIQHHVVGRAYPEVGHHEEGFWRKLFQRIKGRKNA